MNKFKKIKMIWWMKKILSITVNDANIFKKRNIQNWKKNHKYNPSGILPFFKCNVFSLAFLKSS